MSGKPFVHLHCHTDYSLLDGACEIGKLMKLVQRQGQPAVALTDHGNLFGAVEFYKNAKEHGVHPVIGCEVYVARQSRLARTEGYNHLVLLCENQEGYRNLIQLVSSGFLEGFYYKPRIDKDLLARHSRGLIAMSACLKGDINESILADRYEEARRLAHEYRDLFGRDNFFLELQHHGLAEDGQVLPGVYRLAAETGIPLVATNDAHYLQHEDAKAQEVLTCIQTGKTLHDEKRMRFSTDQFFIKSRAEMMQVFGEVEEALDRTWDIAQRCQVQLAPVENPFPRFDVPKEFTAGSYFEYVTRQGFERRRGRLEQLAAQGRLKHDLGAYTARLEQEIELIKAMKFAGYFLIVWDFIRYAKGRGIPVGPGRGSAAGSFVAYCLGITDVDPLYHGLLFERFLNPERVSLPDIDIDFCTHRRGEVIQYVTEKYGREQVAQIITFGTLGAKAALKDVGRVLGLGFSEVDKITKLVPAELNIRLRDALEKEPDLQDLYDKEPQVHEMFDIALRLEGMARNASVHAAGVVISPQPLTELVPLYKTNKDEIVTQFDMASIEELGLLKMDFLGLTTLTIVNETLNLIRQTQGREISLEDLPPNDAETYATIFSEGLTDGVFQFESPGMKDALRRYRPERLEDLIALAALYRPGPLKGGVVDDFIDRKHGRKHIAYELPALKPILEETYGVILYQEQVMQVAQLVAGYSLGEADLLRRAMGKKKPEEMARQRERFLSGARKLGCPEKKAEKLFDLMAQFAEYGFNKSHAAAYGYLAYLTGYLKAHYKVEFMSALLTSESGNTAKVVRYINECRARQIAVLPPDINASGLNFTPGEGAIRFGLGAVKNVGANAVEAILRARDAGGRFVSLDDFCERVDLGAVNRRVIESLVKAGAMDSFPGTRAQKMAVLDDCIETGHRAQKDLRSGQAGLFGGLDGSADDARSQRRMPNVADWTRMEMLRGEKETIGFYVTGHPLDDFREKVAELSTHGSETAAQAERGQEVVLCGILTGIQRKRNREQKPWASMQLEDWHGATDLLVFAAKFEQLQHELAEDRPVLVRAKALPEEDGSVKLSAQEMTALDAARLDYPSIVAIRLRVGANDGGASRAERLKALIESKPGGASVRLRLEKSGDFVLNLDLPHKVRPDKEFRAGLEAICGPGAFEVLAS
jgi:DNA polymerase-3 subunit alpha